MLKTPVSKLSDVMGAPTLAGAAAMATTERVPETASVHALWDAAWEMAMEDDETAAASRVIWWANRASVDSVEEVAVVVGRW